MTNQETGTGMMGRASNVCSDNWPPSCVDIKRIEEITKSPHAVLCLSRVNRYSDPEVQGDQLTGPQNIYRAQV